MWIEMFPVSVIDPNAIEVILFVGIHPLPGSRVVHFRRMSFRQLLAGYYYYF